ncbi:MAG: hypothetical protein F8N37_09535 [Telmatospirillum sp.]|nr:hypothetical protein [Telmatospirillum sp.]
MKAGSILFAIVPLLLPCAGTAAEIPNWLLGDWIVTKVYQAGEDVVRYQEPEAEPVVRLTGKTMTVEPNRLSLGGEVCADISVRKRRDTIRHLVKDVELGAEPEIFGLTPRPGRLPYLEINCGRSLTEEKDGQDDRHINYIDWIVIPNGHDKIDLMFMGPCYVELRRKEKPES